MAVTHDRVFSTGSSEYKSREGVAIDTYQVHHGTLLSLSQLLNMALPGGRKVSFNHAVGTDGTRVLVVPYAMRAFTSASAFDRRCITAETVNTSLAPNWGISNESHKAHGRTLGEMHLTYGTKIAYGVGGLIFHRDVPGTYATACPGPSMDGDLILHYAREFVAGRGGAPSNPTQTPAPAGGGKSNEQLAVEVLAGQWGNGDERKRRLTAAGYSYDAVMSAVNAKLSPSKPAPTVKTVRQGARGDQAHWVLAQLQRHGFYKGLRNDSYLGPIGVRELKRFQKAKGLVADGWLTWGSGQTYSALAAGASSGGGSSSSSGGFSTSNKAQVRALQTFLKSAFSLYASHLVVDGIYGSQTANVVREFQRRSGLTVDGIVGAKQTLPALRKAGFRG